MESLTIESEAITHFKEHGRSKVTNNQGEYIAKRMKRVIEQGLIQSLDDQKRYFVELAQEFQSTMGKGKEVTVVRTTTLYDFLRKYKILPYSKMKNKKSGKVKMVPIPIHEVDTYINTSTSDKTYSTFSAIHSNNPLTMSKDQLLAAKKFHEEEEQILNETLHQVKNMQDNIGDTAETIDIQFEGDDWIKYFDSLQCEEQNVPEEAVQKTKKLEFVFGDFDFSGFSGY